MLGEAYPEWYEGLKRRYEEGRDDFLKKHQYFKKLSNISLFAQSQYEVSDELIEVSTIDLLHLLWLSVLHDKRQQAIFISSEKGRIALQLRSERLAYH